MKTKSILALVAMIMVSVTALAGDEVKEFAVNPGQTLEIDLDTGGSVSVRGGGENKVTVRARMTGQDANDIELRIDRTSNGVKVESEYRSSRKSRSGGVDLEITVPSRFDLDIETLGGKIAVDGVEGYLEGSTMGGQLDLRNLKGTVAMSTMGGNVILLSSKVDGEVSTMGGRVELRDVEGNVKGKSMGGNVIYDNVRPVAGAGAKPVEISTMGGDIEVPSAPAGATVSTMGGDIDVRSAAEFVKAKTMGGDITIDEIDGWVEASTMGGDIEVRVTGTGGDRHIDLDSKGGDILVVLPANFAMDVDIEVTYGRRGRDGSAIRSDFALNVDDMPDSFRGGGTIRGTGKVNGGGNKVRIRTTDGEVTLRKK